MTRWRRTGATIDGSPLHGSMLARGAAIILASCAGLATAPARAEDATAAPVPIAEIIVRRAAHECFTSLIHASGYLVPRRSAVVMFAAPGYRITEVSAKVGDTVKRGDSLARAVAAGAPPATSPPPEKANAPADVALRAPASGLVMQATAFPGMPTAETPTPLFTLAVDGTIEAAVDVPSVHILELQDGQVAHVTMRDGTVHDGHVRRTPAVVEAASQMGSTRLSIDAPQGLDPSRFIQATIEARRSCGLAVPMAALRRTSAGSYVQVVEHDVIIDRSVTLGLHNEIDSEVTAGLAEGDLVVAGTGSSREGDHVTPVLADTQDAR